MLTLSCGRQFSRGTFLASSSLVCHFLLVAHILQTTTKSVPLVSVSKGRTSLLWVQIDVYMITRPPNTPPPPQKKKQKTKTKQKPNPNKTNNNNNNNNNKTKTNPQRNKTTKQKQNKTKQTNKTRGEEFLSLPRIFPLPSKMTECFCVHGNNY